MAKLVYGAGSSHTPMLTIHSTDWFERAKADYVNPALTTTDGGTLNYQELQDLVGNRYAGEIAPEILEAKSVACQAALDRLADDLEAVAPDVVIIVGDDQEELFGLENTPVVCVYYGDQVKMHSDPDAELPAWQMTMKTGYAMDAFHEFPCQADLARDIISGMLDHDVDVASSSGVPNPAEAGFGHAFGFIIRRLFKQKVIPVIPVLLNTYYPPSVASAARAFDIGRALRKAVEASPLDLRVAIISSGGLSHFVVDEGFDREIIEAMTSGRSEDLRRIPRHALRSGSSEILNWILGAGAMEGKPVAWSEYIPLYRTAAGTGTGAAFVSWVAEQ